MDEPEQREWRRRETGTSTWLAVWLWLRVLVLEWLAAEAPRRVCAKARIGRDLGLLEEYCRFLT
jgi:hypothetical protein